LAVRHLRFAGRRGNLRRIRDWIRRGGTLITIAEASRWAAGERINLLETRTELRGGRPEVDERPGTPAAGAASGQNAPPGQNAGANPQQAFDYTRSIQPERERPENTPGAILRVITDQEHWLNS